LELRVKGLSALRLRIDTLCFLPLVLACLALPLFVTPVTAAAEKYAALVIDANTGETLHARFADSPRFPASLTKIMTLYVLFEELQAGRLSLESQLSVSANAAAQAPSKVGVKAGSTIKVEDAIQALTTKSANDVSVVIAENVGGSVSEFASRMNRAARALGMNSTTFRNPNGLPDPGQVTTARDLAKLGLAVQERFPAYYKYFGVRTFTYKGMKLRNHNKLLGSVEGVDGIKTGYTRASGFNLVTNVRRGDRHLIAVVMGGKTGASRDAEMRKLISRYLPASKEGDRSPPLLVADSSDAQEAPLPRARPGSEAPVALSYAPAAPTRDLVTAAMAESPVRDDPAAQAGARTAPDPVSLRIAIANEVAGLAFEPSPAADEAVARLTARAQIRAGKQDMVAAARTQDMTAGAAAISQAPEQQREAGWHIQIGAVPTIEAAEALLDNAQNSMGSVLAPRRPVTQQVERDGTTLYRARFAGFSDKDQARSACAKLMSKSFSCLAVPN
jgi:D-alanyl-D-alanine carboxypeptidase